MGVPAEVPKYRGQVARTVLGDVAREMWRKALGSLSGHEGEDWLEGWSIGIVVSIWKAGRKMTKIWVDDALQVSQRLVEDTRRTARFLLSLFDIEKANPRVCREALWEGLRQRGCPNGLTKVCKTFHEHTAYAVTIIGGLSVPVLAPTSQHQPRCGHV